LKDDTAGNKIVSNKTITEILACMTTADNDEITFVSAVNKVTGETVTNANLYAAGCDKIVVKVAGNEVTLTVSATALTGKFAVTFDPTMIKVMDGATEITESPILAVNNKTFTVTVRDGYTGLAADPSAALSSGTLTVTADVKLTARAETQADKDAAAVAAAETAIGNIATPIAFVPDAKADLTEEAALAYVTKLVKDAVNNPDVAVEVSLDDTWDDSSAITNLSAVYAAATPTTYVAYGYTATVTAGQSTESVDVDNVRHGYAKAATTAAADAAKAAVAAVLKDEYSISEESYKNWPKFQAAIVEAINGVDGISAATIAIKTGGPDFTDGKTEWKAGISFTIEYGFTCSDGASGTQNVTGVEKVITLEA